MDWGQQGSRAEKQSNLVPVEHLLPNHCKSQLLI